MEEFLSRRAIRRLAGKRRHEWAEETVAAGQVKLETVESSHVKAVVTGKSPWNVALAVEGEQLQWSCSCRNGKAGEFCKHCAAVALAWNRHQNGDATDQDDPMDKIRQFLKSQKKGKLVRWILDEVELDPSFYQWVLEKMVPAARPTDQEQAPPPESLDEIWRQFQANPNYELYQVLQATAEARGEWGEWRHKALQHLLEHDPARQARPDRTGVVQQLLSEAPEAPEDATELRHLIEGALARRTSQAYAQSVTWLEALHRLEDKASFSRYVQELREAHKSKKGFIKLLDETSWA
jgi:uncharacterized Zn finger protein